jgi:hypothetical protein
VLVGSTNDLTFTVRNTGGGTLAGNASVPAPFSIVGTSAYSLASNATQVITVRYIPTQAGSSTQTVTFTGAGGASAAVSGSASLPAAIAVTPGSGVSFQWRDTANAAYATNSGTTGLVAPYWVRITRTGNVFKAERSADGKTWTQQGVDTTVSMTANVYIGMAVTSHDAALTTVAEISNVSASGTITGQWQAVAIGATMRTNDPAPLYLTVEDKAGMLQVVQVARDVGLRGAQHALDVANTEFAAPQRQQYHYQVDQGDGRQGRPLPSGEPAPDGERAARDGRGGSTLPIGTPLP